MQHVFIIGAKSLGAYGGYETFVYKLTEYHQNLSTIKYHISCKANGNGCMDESKYSDVIKINDYEFGMHNAHCIKIPIPNIGSASAIYYDIVSLLKFCNYIKKNNIENPIVYILACRIGPFARFFYKKIHRLGGKVFLNPDGHEWLRSKWKKPIRMYWKMSELLMVKYSDLVICDSLNIQNYIKRTYKRKCYHNSNPKTIYIAYGADLEKSKLSDHDDCFLRWLDQNDISVNNYYLIVGRFVPENNYVTMIREFMKSNSNRDLVIVTNNNIKFYEYLKSKLNFQKDSRIKFVGTVYEQDLLKKIRENAFAYIHGHEVGGTNPSLIESMCYTKLNLLLNVNFNREVGQKSVFYWDKKSNSLADLINLCDKLKQKEIDLYSQKATLRVKSAYSWNLICDRYKDVFLSF